jgi:signal transduction histidine kinase
MLSNRLHASADRMNTLIARLQDQSDLQRGVGLELALVDAVPLMREATRELEARVQQLDLTLTLNTPAALPVRADALRLRQVFSRLLSSAVGRAEAGGSVVIEGAAAGDHVLFRIQDSGPSMAQANQRVAPGELFPVNAGDTEPAAGVGLAVVRAIVEGHQGRIWLESTPGKGSAFCFTVPLGELRVGS